MAPRKGMEVAYNYNMKNHLASVYSLDNSDRVCKVVGAHSMEMNLYFEGMEKPRPVIVEATQITVCNNYNFFSYEDLDQDIEGVVSTWLENISTMMNSEICTVTAIFRDDNDAVEALGCYVTFYDSSNMSA